MNENRAPNEQHCRTGFALGLLAYALWGVLPIYFKKIEELPALDIVAHRIIWSLPFLAILIPLSKGWPKVREAISTPRVLGILAITALPTRGHCLLYVHAVTPGHSLA